MVGVVVDIMFSVFIGLLVWFFYCVIFNFWVISVAGCFVF